MALQTEIQAYCTQQYSVFRLQKQIKYSVYIIIITVYIYIYSSSKCEFGQSMDCPDFEFPAQFLNISIFSNVSME